MLLSFAWWDLFLPRLGLRAWALRTRPARLQHAAAAFRQLAIQMGGVMIKVGQFLSTRVDVLPKEVTDELAGLQDEVPAENYEDIRAVAEAELGGPLAQKFAFFDHQPLAAASLGQAHTARLHQPSGAGDTFTDVVVKVQRPHIEDLIATDLAALRTVGGWLNRYKPISRRADVPALLDEFTRILYQEIDYQAEGHNAETFAGNFANHPDVRVPRVVWTHTTRRVLTLENVLAIKITDYDAITAAGIDRGAVAARLLHTYLQQIFEDGFFHADPHPGNLFVRPLPRPAAEGAPASSEPASPAWQLTFIDFGMVGHVPSRLSDGLREMLIGVGTQDAARVVHSYEMLGFLLPGADLSMLERAEARVFERFWGKNMSELTHEIDTKVVGEFLSEFRDLIYSLPFQVPHDIIFLGRTVAILSGMCTGLDPEFNLWDHIAPYAQKLISQDARTRTETILEEVGNLVRSLVAVPRKMDLMLTRMERGEIAVRAPEVSRQVNRLESALRQVAGSVIFAALLITGIQLYLAGRASPAYVLLAGAGLSLLWLLMIGRRHGDGGGS